VGRRVSDRRQVHIACEFNWLALLLLAQATSLHAQIAVSANDGKQKAADAKSEPLTPDSVAILDLAAPVRVLATLEAPASLIGPPASVAMARDSSFAIITAAQQPGADDMPVPADIVTVVDLADPSKPRVVQSLHAGAGASGVAINEAGTLALVANAGADSVSVFAIAGRRLSSIGTVALPPKSKPVDLAFSRDRRSAYVVAQGDGALVRLAVDGQRVAVAESITLGIQPDSMALNTAKQVAYVTNLGGREPGAAPGPKMGTIAIVDLRRGRLVGQIDVGVTPEHVGLSPSGRFLQATVINGSNAPAASSNHHDHGTMVIFRARGAELEPLARIETGAWCQGAVWSDDEKFVFLQCAARKQIEVYRFDGRNLTVDSAATVQLGARPGAMATARSR
jgi:DNA-binding beta-propeller fold protein YncE